MFSLKREVNLSQVILACLGLFLVTSGCQAQDDNTNKQQPADAEITAAVTGDLMSARGIDAEVLTVETEDGIVTISGTTDNILTKERATRVASSIKGVRSVVNDMNIVSSKSEDLVREDIETALMVDPATEKWEIDATVVDGVVTLTGVVDSWQEKDLAETIVKGVEGVLAINNNLSVDYEEDRSDSQIRQEIVSAISWNNRIDSGLLDVEVNDGMVELSGSLASLYEKNLATGEAYVAGVKDVDASSVEIEPWLKDDMERESFTGDKSDSEIEEAIREALDRHPRVDADAVEVSVVDNIATLRGNLTNLKASRAAAEVASNTHGVYSVDNKLDVINEINIVPDVNLTDAEIKVDVLGALARDPYVSSLDIDADVQNGIVTLSGTADTYFEKYEADEVASRINGVTRVINNISVDYTALEYSPMYYDWDVIDNDYDYEQVSLSDEELKEAVTEELIWSPFVTAANVQVEVENGVVTLDGLVMNSFAANEAISEAYEAGAIKVNSELEQM